MEDDDSARNLTVQFRLEVPEAMENGTYSNFLSVWSSPHDFTLDFAVLGRADTNEEARSLTVPARLVARIKVPVSVMGDMVRAITQHMESYDRAAGEIRAASEGRETPERREELG